MRLPALALVLLGVAGCADDTATPRTYANNDLELAVANAARTSCSCLFVMKMSEPYCKAWVKASPNVARFSVNWSERSVEASSFISVTAHAHYVDDRHGCVLE